MCNTPGTVYELEAVLANSGAVTLGPGSTLDVPGTFAQNASGTLTTQVGGNPASGQFGRIAATVPRARRHIWRELGQWLRSVAAKQFPILTFPSAAGSFSEFTGLDGGRLPLFTVDQIADERCSERRGERRRSGLQRVRGGIVPPTATPGQNVSVAYDVRNLSTRLPRATGIDSLYLCATAVWMRAMVAWRVAPRGGSLMSTYGRP